MARLLKLFQWIGALLLLLSAVGATALIMRCLFISGALDYAAIGELGLVLVLAVEGLVAMAAFATDERTSKINANSALFTLYQMYLSIDYHDKVRTPAWYALHKARESSEYRNKLIQELIGRSAGQHHRKYYERKCAGLEETEDDKKYWQFHKEYHRVFDLLGFFTTLAHLSLHLKDDNVIRSCNFYYDSWRGPLHRIVEDAEAFVDSQPNGTLNNLEKERCRVFKETLQTLDHVFKLESYDWRGCPTGKNEDIPPATNP